MDAKEEYRSLCDTYGSSIPLMAQAWWFEAVSTPVNKEWGAIIIKDEDGKTCAALPYQLTKRGPFTAMLMPQLTQVSYIWTAPEVDRLVWLEKMLEELKKFCSERRTVMVQFSSYLAEGEVELFKKHGFEIEERVSYRIEPKEDFQEIENNFHQNIRRAIKKTDNLLHFEQDASTDTEFFSFFRENLAQRNKKPFYPEALWKSLYLAGLKRDQSTILWAHEGWRTPRAAVMMVWDENIAYYLVPTFTKTETRNDSLKWLTRECIHFVTVEGMTFDFEGSVEPGIARAYRHFGGVAHTYYFCSWYANSCLKRVLHH